MKQLLNLLGLYDLQYLCSKPTEENSKKTTQNNNEKRQRREISTGEGPWGVCFYDSEDDDDD